MRYQTYVLHLIDGTAIPMAEDYDLPAEKGIVGHFSKISPHNHIAGFQVNNAALGDIGKAQKPVAHGKNLVRGSFGKVADRVVREMMGL